MTRSICSCIARHLWLALLATPLCAQSVLTGVVRDDSTGAPLVGVEVLINRTPHRTETNAQGRYLLGGLPTGTHMAIYRLVGHLPVRIDVLLRAGDTTRANTTLIKSAVVLNPVIVTGTPETTRGIGIGREAFEERRRMGFGLFFDSTDMRRNEHRTLGDMARGHVGIYVPGSRNSAGGGIIYNNRRNPPCPMFTYFDGIPMGVVDTKQFPSYSLEAAEIYYSAANLPTEYGGANAACGIILLWSRRGR